MTSLLPSCVKLPTKNDSQSVPVQIVSLLPLDGQQFIPSRILTLIGKKIATCISFY